jgi:integrase
LSKLAVEILSRALTRDARALVFGDGSGPFQGWSKAKAALDKRLGIESWRLHDIRRTVATGMADLGVQPHVIEAVLNHVSGHKAGVAGVYNRARYTHEKRVALSAWADHVESLVRGTERTLTLIKSPHLEVGVA